MSSEVCLVVGFVLGCTLTTVAIMTPLLILYSTWKKGYENMIEFLAKESATSYEHFLQSLGFKAEMEMFKEGEDFDPPEDTDMDERPRKW